MPLRPSRQGEKKSGTKFPPAPLWLSPVWLWLWPAPGVGESAATCRKEGGKIENGLSTSQVHTEREGRGIRNGVHNNIFCAHFIMLKTLILRAVFLSFRSDMRANHSEEKLRHVFLQQSPLLDLLHQLHQSERRGKYILFIKVQIQTNIYHLCLMSSMFGDSSFPLSSSPLFLYFSRFFLNCSWSPLSE